MKVRADEHVAHRIVSLIRDMTLSQNWDISHVMEVGHQGKADEYWVTSFANTEAGEAILSADSDFYKKTNQVLAVQRTGLKIICLPYQWANSPCHLQAAHILSWWDRIEKKLSTCGKRECWQVPWDISLKGELIRKALDFENAVRKAKRQEKKLRKRPI